MKEQDRVFFENVVGFTMAIGFLVIAAIGFVGMISKLIG